MRPWLPYQEHRITRWPSLLRAAVFLLLTAAPPLFGESELDDDPMSMYGYPSCNFSAPGVPAADCTAYLTFRPAPPLYSSPVSVSYLLNANASAVAAANNITLAVLPAPDDHKFLVPVPCSCSYSGHYQHNTTYILTEGSTPYFIARDTFQNLSTYQAINSQNNPNERTNAQVNDIITVPLICACPSAWQAAAGVRYMVTYYAGEEDDHAVARRFRVDLYALRAANRFPGGYRDFTGGATLLVPLKNPPTPDMLALLDPTPAPAPAPAPVVVPASHCCPRSRMWIDVGVGSGCGVVVSVGIVTIHILCRRRCRRRRPQLDRTSLDKGTTLVAAVRDAVDSLVVYTYLELDRATAGFAEERRVAAGSSVFRAVINGQAFAVKHVAADVRGEVGLLARVSHSCLVRLSGLCVHRGDTYLVLDFAENGALCDWLHGGGGGGDTNTACLLSWKQRVQVACDVASGLSYLHHFTSPPYVHKNLSCRNVLLDAKFRAKVSNFGLARAVAAASTGSDDGGSGVQATRHVVGTQGYLAPEYLEHGLISTHLDVFSFGVILLELLSGKEAVFVAADGHASLLWEAVEGTIADGDGAWFSLKEFMDPRLHGHYPFGLAFTMAALALRCVAREPRARPSMSEVLVLLSAVHDSTADWDPQNYGISESMVVGR